MIISSEKTTLKEAFRDHKPAILDLLRTTTPEKAAIAMEKSGWPREWACKAVVEIETTRNPANLPNGWASNQRLREKHGSAAMFGACLFIVGALVSLATLGIALHSGGWILITYGAVITGAGLWLKNPPEVKKYPDRRLPLYVPPRDPKNSDPSQY